MDARPVPGFPDYLVSSDGQIVHAAKGTRARRATPSDSGYQRVWLGDACVRVHRCVLLAFIGPAPTPRHRVAHNDGNKANNALWNLEWKLPEANEADKKLHGTAPRGGAQRMPSPQVIGRIRARVGRGESYTRVARAFRLHRSSVSRYARGIRRAA